MGDTTITNPGEALRLAILGALREIEARLASPSPSAADAHLARRAAKRARALARLAREHVPTLARQTSRAVGEARRLLGAARDADVRRATLAQLQPRLGKAHGRLAAILSGNEPAPAADASAEIRATIAALIRDWTLCDAACGIDEVIDAAARVYRKSKRRAGRASGGGSEELHHWRTAVVDHEYQAAFLANFVPDMAAQAASADLLRAHLGDINDLDMLAAFVRMQSANDHTGKTDVRRFEHVIAARRAKLLEKARRLAGRAFSNSPSTWAEKVRRSCGR